MMALDEIEMRHWQADLGRMAVTIYKGALDESGGRRQQALWATVAVVYAMLTQPNDEEEQQEEGEQ